MHAIVDLCPQGAVSSGPLQDLRPPPPTVTDAARALQFCFSGAGATPCFSDKTDSSVLGTSPWCKVPHQLSSSCLGLLWCRIGACRREARCQPGPWRGGAAAQHCSESGRPVQQPHRTQWTLSAGAHLLGCYPNLVSKIFTIEQGPVHRPSFYISCR